MCSHHIVRADHPVLDRDVELFLHELRAERRSFGPSARPAPKPFPSLLTALAGRGGFRLAAVECGRIVGLARVDGAGELFLAVAADRRGAGIGTALARAAVERAIDLNYRRLTIRTTRRGRAIRRLGHNLGCLVVERAFGRTDLILELPATERIA